jgi:hypothetical protein
MQASRKMGELIDGLLKLAQVWPGELQRQPVNLSADRHPDAGRAGAAESTQSARWTGRWSPTSRSPPIRR